MYRLPRSRLTSLSRESAAAPITTLRTSVERAAQIVWTLASPDVGRMLCDVQGWTSDEYAAWLEETLAETLLPHP